jgi:hypothetical protein
LGSDADVAYGVGKTAGGNSKGTGCVAAVIGSLVFSSISLSRHKQDRSNSIW